MRDYRLSSTFLSLPSFTVDSLTGPILQVRRDAPFPNLVAMWKWLRKKILQEFPNRNYNRAISVPETVMPQNYLDFETALKNKVSIKAKL